MNFVNNWSSPIELAAGVTSVSLNLPDGAYRPTLTDSAEAATRWEIVDAVVAGGVATLTRGVEGTIDQAWPSGSVIYVGVTAGFLQSIQNSGGAAAGSAEFSFSDEGATITAGPGLGMMYLGQDGNAPLQGLRVTLPDLAPSLHGMGRSFELQVDGDGGYTIDLDLSKTIAAANAQDKQWWLKGSAQIVGSSARFELTGADRFTVRAMGIFEYEGALQLKLEIIQSDGFFIVANN